MQTEKEERISGILLDHYDMYYRLAFSYVHNESDAMDIVQEGAYRAIRKADTLKEDSFAETWIYRIMLNQIFQCLRAHQKEQIIVPKEEAAKEDTYADVDLRQAIDNLQEKDKALIIMRFYEDKALEQIAVILEENLNTVKSRLYRTLKKLRIELEDE